MKPLKDGHQGRAKVPVYRDVSYQGNFQSKLHAGTRDTVHLKEVSLYQENAKQELFGQGT